MSSKILNGFHITLSGELAGLQMMGVDDVYCKYSFNYGVDWKLLHGLEHGITQVARSTSSISSSIPSSSGSTFVWNFPLELSLRSTNVHGWPQIIVTVYRINALGKDIIAGYGAIHLPTTPGHHIRYIRLYTPVSSSLCQRIMNFFQGSAPEFFNSKFISQGQGREVARVQSSGTVKVAFNISMKNMSEWGYENTPFQAALVSSIHSAITMRENYLTNRENGSGITTDGFERKNQQRPAYMYDDGDGDDDYDDDDDDIKRQVMKNTLFNQQQQQNLYSDQNRSNTQNTQRAQYTHSDRILHQLKSPDALGSTASNTSNTNTTAYNFSGNNPFNTTDLDDLSNTPKRNTTRSTSTFTPFDPLGSPIAASEFSPRSKAAERTSLLRDQQSTKNTNLSSSTSTMGRSSTTELPETYSALGASSLLSPRDRNNR